MFFPLIVGPGAKNVMGSLSDSSAVSTPQTNGGKNRAARKPLPTIPQYRKGDIAVTGLSLS